MPEATVLLAIREPAASRALSRELVQHGVRVVSERELSRALRALRGRRADALVVDAALAGPSAAELLARLRADPATRDVRVLWVGRDEEEARARALEAGADDAAGLARGARELSLRVRALLRRGSFVPARGRSSEVEHRWARGGLRVDPSQREVRVGDRRLALSPREVDLLWALARADGAVVRREELLRCAWGRSRGIGARAVDTYVNRLRAKLGAAASLVETVRGVGYRLRVEELSSS